MEDKKLFFNVLNGKLNEVDADRAKLQNKFQIPLLKAPKASCKKCSGRGFIGFYTKMKYYQICPCLRKSIDFTAIKEIPEQKD